MSPITTRAAAGRFGRACLALAAGAIASLAAPAAARAQLSAEPDPTSFGEVRVGAGATRDITVSSGLVGSTGVTCSIADPAGDFSVVSCPGAVAAGGSETITVAFDPAARGDQEATLTVTGNLGNTSDTVTLLGTGVAGLLAVSPASLAFGTVPVGSSSAAQPVTVTNAGDADLTVQSASIPGEGAGDYQVTGLDAPAVLAPGGSLELQIAFSPQAAGARNASLVVTSDSPVAPASRQVALTGSGSGAGDVTLSPTALTFGAIDVHTGGSAARTVTVGNTGNIPLEITSIALEALDGAPYEGGVFAVSAAAPLVIAPAASVDVEVVYAPLVEANDYAVLVMETSAPDAPRIEVSLAGRGVDRHIAVSSLAIEFPPTYRNPVTPTTVPLVVENTGESPLAISAVTLGGPDAASFTLVGELPAVIAPLSSARIQISFAPVSAGPEPIRGEILLVNDDDERPMLRIDLGGLGVLPPIEASAAALDFGSAAVGLEVLVDAGAPLRLVNRSEVDTFTVQGARVVGPAGDVVQGYQIAGLEQPVRLAPGQEVRIEVVFLPSIPGDHSGTLELLVDEDPLGLPIAEVTALAVSGRLRGSGCAAAGGAGGGGPATALGLLALLVVARRRRARLAAAAAMVLVALAARPARAQEEPAERQTRNLDLTTFRPAHGTDPALLTVDSSRVGRSGDFALDLWFGYAHNPLLVEGDGGEMVDRPVVARATAELSGTYAFAGRFEVTAVVPLLLQDGERPAWSGVAPAEGAALGDLRLHGKMFLLARAGISTGLLAELTAPTGGDQEFAGAAGPSAGLRALVDLRRGPVTVAFNGGGVMRHRARLADVEQGHGLTFALAGAYQATRRLSGIAELFGSIDLGGGPAGARPVEAALGARYRLNRELALVAGLGRGLLPGVGAPELRLFAAVNFAPAASPLAITVEDRLAALDDDGDGIANALDRCPRAREDLDGFQDGDGCPDLDDDGDGLGDRLDPCPREAEDRDGHQDEDGCPDPDNDGDGTLDERDDCPMEREDADGHLDGDGCPDPDNDRDGVLDGADQCTDQPEVINGNADDDGCPDEGEPLVLVSKDGLELFEPIRFRGDTAELSPGSTGLLGQVAATLRAHREIARLRIRAHVHSRGTDADDDQLSVERAEAVRRWLIEWGIDADRLEGVGHGSRAPLLKGTGERARQLNDRIELEIGARQKAP